MKVIINLVEETNDGKEVVLINEETKFSKDATVIPPEIEAYYSQDAEIADEYKEMEDFEDMYESGQELFGFKYFVYKVISVCEEYFNFPLAPWIKKIPVFIENIENNNDVNVKKICI